MDKYTDYKRNYLLRIQAGFIVAISLAIIVFNLNFSGEREIDPQTDLDNDIQTVEIPLTVIPKKTPAPPRPNVTPVEDAPQILDDMPDIDLPDLMDEPLPDAPPPNYYSEPEDEDEIFEAVEMMPGIVGGLEALYKEINYPPAARRTGITGQVIVQLLIGTDGTVESAEVVRGVHPLLDDEALRAIQKMQFTPGIQQGRPVRVRMLQSIRFQLD